MEGFVFNHDDRSNSLVTTIKENLIYMPSSPLTNIGIRFVNVPSLGVDLSLFLRRLKLYKR
jgi:hypothetical protein